jgi:hypothetical protein
VRGKDKVKDKVISEHKHHVLNVIWGMEAKLQALWNSSLDEDD